MKLSISNIAWTSEQDETVYGRMRECGFEGLEIAPTRIFPENPYEHRQEAAEWAHGLRRAYGFSVPSMQSIWYGRPEKLFGTKEERKALAEYTKKAIDFAEAVGCRNLVFGCPRNRCLPEKRETQAGDRIENGNKTTDVEGWNNKREGEQESEWMETASRFFRELGEYALAHGTVIGMEANPPMYHTNFINTTKEALELVKRVDSRGFLLNLDVGTMLACGEDCTELQGSVRLINHVHISEPGLKPVQKRALHQELKKILREEHYDGFVSIEMGKTEDGSLRALKDAMAYVQFLFRHDGTGTKQTDSGQAEGK